MDILDFRNKVSEISVKQPRLFALKADNRANADMIDAVEKYYDVRLPDCYKEFVKQFGGGYFGFIVVYSCDNAGMFYIADCVSKERISVNSFLPVVDFETGDYLGFKIIDGICQDIVILYSHGENKMDELEMDFWSALLKYGLMC